MNCISQICCFHVALISCLAIIRVYHIFVSISTCALREEGDTEHHPAAGKHQYFYPRPPRGGRLISPLSRSFSYRFLSTSSARRATREIFSRTTQRPDFYPRPPRGGRLHPCTPPHQSGLFLSTPSARRATGLDGLACGDGNADFYPRPPRGGRQTHGNKAPPEYRFLSTPSARRATSCGAYHQSVRHYFYPRPPRGGRPDGAGHGRRTCCISIHALREEGDCAGYVVIGDTLVFLSTPSARRATLWLSMSMMITAYFYPRPPRGGRPRIACAWPTSFIFLSTPSARRATWQLLRLPDHRSISIHALREEGDAISPINPTSGGNFYPRPPRGGRLFKRSKQLRPAQFLSTPSARRATLVRDFCYCGQIISIHALREEGDPFKAGQHW